MTFITPDRDASRTKHRAGRPLAVISVVVVTLTAVGCGTSAISARTTTRATTTTAAAPAPTSTTTTTTTTAPAPTSTTVRKQSPWPTLVYAGPGVAVVGVSPEAGGPGPSHLYLSTDLVHWRDVTPAQCRRPENGGCDWFEHASFLNPLTGWVTMWNAAVTLVTILRTTDGGKAWTVVMSNGYHPSLGDTLIQLLNPSTVILENLVPTAPEMQLEISNNDGETWKTIYRGPAPIIAGGSAEGPFNIPIVFSDINHAFGSGGDPPSAFNGNGDSDFFYSSDGGNNWSSETPPLPQVKPACPVGFGNGSEPACVFATPMFSDPEHGVLAGIAVSDTTANVAFDVTSDGGMLWSLQSQRSATVPKANAASGFNYPLVSIASPSSWWVVGWTSTGLTTQVTGDAGTSWTENSIHAPNGTPVALAALNANTAILNVQQEGPFGATGEVLVTTDAGRNWKPLSLGT